jgi:hypothetical protein
MIIRLVIDTGTEPPSSREDHRPVHEPRSRPTRPPSQQQQHTPVVQTGVIPAGIFMPVQQEAYHTHRRPVASLPTRMAGKVLIFGRLSTADALYLQQQSLERSACSR